MNNWQKIKNDPSLIGKFLVREQVIDAIRSFFKLEGLREVETPLMVKYPSMEPYLEPFETELLDVNGDKKSEAYLIMSPEYSMKKLLSAGVSNIFQICKVFRNREELDSSSHNPEFTMIEWYRSGVDYLKIMNDCERLVCFIYDWIEIVKQGEKYNYSEVFINMMDNKEFILRELTYQGKTINISDKWERLSIKEAFWKYANVEEACLHDYEMMKKRYIEKNYAWDQKTSWEQMYNQIFLNEVEIHLGKVRPTILYDYPVSQAALSKKKESDPRYAERFEFYIFGKEIGNAFTELTDAQEQETRLSLEKAERRELNKKEYQIDQDFINALNAGMPECAGIAVGVDRLVMLFADAVSMQETLFFPAREMF